MPEDKYIRPASSDLYELTLKAGWLSTYDGKSDPDTDITAMLYYEEAKDLYKQLRRLFEEGDLRFPTRDKGQLDITDQLALEPILTDTEPEGSSDFFDE